MLVVMRLYGWSYAQAAYFVHHSLVLRQFCRVYPEKVPDDTVLFPGHLYSAEPSATMSETRRWNYVFKPGSEAEWLAMFGR